MKKNNYTLEQLASFSGFPSSSILHLEQIGVVAPHRSADNRLYSDEDMQNLDQIRLLQSLGIPFSRIVEIVSEKGFDLPVILEEHLANLLEEQNDIMSVLEFSTASERPELFLRNKRIEELLSRTKKALDLVLEFT